MRSVLAGVEYVQRTAGEYKRTINMLTPNTEEGLKKFDEDLALVHQAFTGHVATYRGHALGSDPSAVCTGETWLAAHALPVGLVDELCTSDAYIRSRQAEVDCFLLRPPAPKRPSGLMSLLRRTAVAATAAGDAIRGAVTDLRTLVGHDPAAGRGGGAGQAVAAVGLATEALASGPPPLLRVGSGDGELGADAARVDGKHHH